MRPLKVEDLVNQVNTLRVTERLFDSAVLFALLELGIFAHLANGPATFDEISSEIGGEEESLRAVVDSAVALKIVQLDGGRYSAPEYLLECLGRPGSPMFLAPWVVFLKSLTTPLMRLSDIVRSSDQRARLIEDVAKNPQAATRMTQAMDVYARSRGFELADRISFGTDREVLDLGCGPGTYSISILDRNPNVHVTLLDLEDPLIEARKIVADHQLTSRVTFICGDAMTYTADHPYHTVLVSNMLHMIGPEKSRSLLQRVYQMLVPGGRVIVQAEYLNSDRTSPRWPTLLNLIQQVSTLEGRNHSISETTEWLHEAGFIDITHRRLSLWNVNSCIIALRPEGSTGR